MIIMKRSPMSRIVKTVLILRGSKRLFSSEEKGRKALEEARKNPVDYKLKNPEKFSAKVEEIDIGGSRCYILSPKKNNPSPKTIIYLHGGAFLRSPTSSHWKFLEKIIARTDATVYFPVYPKIPQHGHKDTSDMLKILYKQVLENTKSEDVILMGDSAGANIILCFALLLKNEKLPQPGQLICFSPCVELSLDNPDITKDLIKSDPMLGLAGLALFVDEWAKGTPIDDPAISPIYGDFSGTAPIVMFMGTDEILLPDTRLFKEKVKKTGTQIKLYEYQFMNHCFFLFPLKEAGDCFEKTINLI